MRRISIFAVSVLACDKHRSELGNGIKINRLFTFVTDKFINLISKSDEDFSCDIFLMFVKLLKIYRK
jgi:hypothetical protein